MNKILQSECKAIMYSSLRPPQVALANFISMGEIQPFEFNEGFQAKYVLCWWAVFLPDTTHYRFIAMPVHYNVYCLIMTLLVQSLKGHNTLHPP